MGSKRQNLRGMSVKDVEFFKIAGGDRDQLFMDNEDDYSEESSPHITKNTHSCTNEEEQVKHWEYMKQLALS